jgi:hypothetical protein
MTMNVTKMEAAVLDHIATNSYQPTNYGRPERFEDTGSIWRHSILDSSSETTVSKSSLPGVTSSLVKKGLIKCTEDGKDSTIALTRDGFDTWLANFPAPSEPEGMDDGTQNPEKGVAPETAEPIAPSKKVVVPDLEAHLALLREEYRNLANRAVTLTTETLVKFADLGRVSSHDGANLGSIASDLQAKAQEIALVENLIRFAA